MPDRERPENPFDDAETGGFRICFYLYRAINWQCVSETLAGHRCVFIYHCRSGSNNIFENCEQDQIRTGECSWTYLHFSNLVVLSLNSFLWNSNYIRILAFVSVDMLVVQYIHAFNTYATYGRSIGCVNIKFRWRFAIALAMRICFWIGSLISAAPHCRYCLSTILTVYSVGSGCKKTTIKIYNRADRSS